MFADTALIILAGGKATRLAGRDKALIELEGEKLLTRKIRRMGVFFKETIVVHGRESSIPEGLPARTAVDPEPGIGPLMGLYTGLAACREPWAFLTGCDMPFFSPALFKHMIRMREDHDAVVPRIGGWYEPLFAFYRTRCLAAARASLEKGERRIVSFFDSISPLYIERETVLRFDPQMHSFFNINTEEDLRKAREMVRETDRSASP